LEYYERADRPDKKSQEENKEVLGPWRRPRNAEWAEPSRPQARTRLGPRRLGPPSGADGAGETIPGRASRSGSSDPPAGAAGAVLQRHAQLAEALADLVAQGEVLGLARLVPQVDEQLHEAGDELVVAAPGLLDRRPEQAEDLRQLAQHGGPAAEL